MTIEVRPVGVTCNLQCAYCYEAGMRERVPVTKYNPDAVKATLATLKESLTRGFSLFGGECLLLPLPQLEDLLRLSYERFGTSGLQTNGTLITDTHIELFKRYHTGVGISVDGPDELNDARWAGTPDATRRMTARTHDAIQRLCDAGVIPTLITTVHAGNCSAEVLPRFIAWLHHLDSLKIRHLSLHLLEMDHHADQWALDPVELGERLIQIWREPFEHLRLKPFVEIEQLLVGTDNVVCTWRGCDPWNTSALHEIEADGSFGHCSRTNKDGVNWLPGEGTGEPAHAVATSEHPGTIFHARQLALYNAPYFQGGCKGCRYWLTCQGHCPGNAMHGDWRYRSMYCETLRMLFAEGERRLRAQGKVPITDRSDRVELEQTLQAAYAAGSEISLTALIARRSCGERSNATTTKWGAVLCQR